MSRRPIVQELNRKLLPAILFLTVMVGGILPSVLLTMNLNHGENTSPEPRSAALAPQFLFNFTDSEFATINGIAINPTAGKIYITNVNGTQHKVLIFDTAGNRLSQIGGASGNGNYAFNTPTGIAVNASGHIFVVDTGNDLVKVYDSAGTFLFNMGSGLFNTAPHSVSVNSSGYIYVSDQGSGGGNRPRALIFNAGGVIQYSFVFDPNNNNPGRLAINSTGYVYAVRTVADDIRVYTCYGAYLYSITGFNAPTGIAINSSQYVHVADAGTSDRVSVYDPAGASCYYLGGSAGQPPMNNPSSVAINSATGLLYELDDGSNIVQVFDTRPPSGIAISINGGTAKTSSTTVTLTLGANYASEMCFSNDGTTWEAWEPLASTKMWTLTSGDGVKTVYFKVRANTESTPIAASITLNTSSGSGVPPEFTTGFLIVEYITFGVLFGAFAVIEVVLPKLKKRREGPTRREEPTRLKAVNKTPDKR